MSNTETLVVLTDPLINQILNLLIKSSMGPEYSFYALGAAAKNLHSVIVTSLDSTISDEAKQIVSGFTEERILQLLRDGFLETQTDVRIAR